MELSLEANWGFPLDHFISMQRVERLTCNRSVMRSNPIKGSRSFLEQDSLPSLLSTCSKKVAQMYEDEIHCGKLLLKQTV